MPILAETLATVRQPTLILGIGNTLLSDDGIGVHVALAIEAQAGQIAQPVRVRDGGTIGLSLLAEIDPGGALIAVDAMELHAPPGTMLVFVGADMDQQLRGTKRSAHEVALADLMQAAEFSGIGPARRALVAIQPEVTTWGLAPTPAVAAAIPQAVAAIRALLQGWADEH
ncbi:hydrogenase maturation protease [Rhodobacter ferrooxidans]|uniref:Hydrogenase maturation protease n=1 Tax=Rhodobacter ferrooxidans TaxID=371731 RepID=C8S1B0_9RHOB|nr:hydrogenase maturation protease [Rhodobacter sp. SW2]EEW25308.1 hydrogenase maturation protease [Rhodobacter sp. SW2]